MDCRRRWAVDDDQGQRKWAVDEDRRRIRWTVEEDRRRRRCAVDEDRRQRRWVVDDDRRRRRWTIGDEEDDYPPLQIPLQWRDPPPHYPALDLPLKWRNPLPDHYLIHNQPPTIFHDSPPLQTHSIAHDSTSVLSRDQTNAHTRPASRTPNAASASSRNPTQHPPSEPATIPALQIDFALIPIDRENPQLEIDFDFDSDHNRNPDSLQQDSAADTPLTLKPAIPTSSLCLPNKPMKKTQLQQKNEDDETPKQSSPESSCSEETVHQPFDPQNKIEEDLAVSTKTVRYDDGDLERPIAETHISNSTFASFRDHFEQPAGDRPLFQGVDHISSGTVRLSQTSIEPKQKGGAGAFFHRVLLDSNHYQNSIPDVRWIWKTDEKFASELLAGVNPVFIAKLKEFPPTNNLDSTLFGEQNSTITTEHIDKNLDSLIAEQALNGSSLLIIKMVRAMALQLALASEVLVQKFLVQIYASFRLIECAKFIFDSISNFKDASRNIMLGGYLKCNLLDDAQQVFDDMLVKGLISWNVMINGLVQNNHFREALELFKMMLMEKMEPNESIYVNVFSICAHLDAVEQCKWEEKYLLKGDFTKKNSLKWSAMMTGLAINNHAEDSLKLFSLMELSGISPREVNFIGLLNVYSHLKLVDEGAKYFKSTVKVYYNQSEVHHYCCLVDLYGRAGMLAKAKEVIKNMPMEPNSGVWGSLLDACKIYGNACLGEEVGKNGVIIEVLRDDCLRTTESFLLDNSRDPNFGEYGFAKLLPILDWYVWSSKTQSTLEYMVPEFACVTVKITKKCDVFEGLVLKTIAKKKPLEHAEDDVMILCYHFSGAMTENKIFDPGGLISPSEHSASTESRFFDGRGV